MIDIVLLSRSQVYTLLPSFRNEAPLISHMLVLPSQRADKQQNSRFDDMEEAAATGTEAGAGVGAGAVGAGAGAGAGADITTGTLTIATGAQERRSVVPLSNLCFVVDKVRPSNDGSLRSSHPLALQTNKSHE